MSTYCTEWYKFNSTYFQRMTSTAPNASVFEDVLQFNVDVIMAKSPIRRHFYTSIYVRVSDKMLFNSDI